MKKAIILMALAGLFSSCKNEVKKETKTTEEKIEKTEKKVDLEKEGEKARKKVEEKVVQKTGIRHTPKTTWGDSTPELLDPNKAKDKAPEKYKVKLITTAGDIVIEVNREWAPNGADRFYNMVKIGYFDDIALFRAVPRFMIQFGIHGNPAISKQWAEAKIQDDPAVKGVSNTPGMLTFATAGPNTRTTQLFINLGNNARLDSQGFTPFGKIVEGMDAFKKINTEYGENSPGVQGNFQAKGNAFISKRYPNLDYIKSAELLK